MENTSFTSAKEFGQKRVEFAVAAKSKEDWDKWEKSKNDFAFDFADCWNQTMEYKVNDFEAEAGFFIDVLGCDCNSISSGYAMFMGPKREFFFSVRKPKEGETATPIDAVKLEFMVKDIHATANKLKDRGVVFEQEIKEDEPGSPLFNATFRSPNGLAVQIWSFQKELMKTQ